MRRSALRTKDVYQLHQDTEIRYTCRQVRRERSKPRVAESNKALVRRFYEEIDKGNVDVLDELVAEDYLDHNPPPFPGLPPGREGLKQAFKIFWVATPGYHRMKIRSPKETG